MKTIFLILFSVVSINLSFSQNISGKKFPFVSGYIGTALPIISFSKDGHSSNVNSTTSLVFPIGFNLNKSTKFSYSIELDPVITFTGNSSSLRNLALLPGILLHQPKLSYGIRAAFETSGRYGMSFSLLKSLTKKDKLTIVLGLALDIRTGNKTPINAGTGIILVIVF
jgi:hypothetical protein